MTDQPTHHHTTPPNSDTTRYVAFDDHKHYSTQHTTHHHNDETRRTRPNTFPRNRWHFVPVVIATGLGSHASKQALAPLMPALANAGVSPLAYALLTIAPSASSVVLPSFWGGIYQLRPRLVTFLAPAGQAAGSLLIALGLLAREHECKPLELGFLISGATAFTVFGTGLSLVQHASIVQCVPHNTVFAFATLVASTHAIGSCVSYAAPRILRVHGLLGVQLALLLPALAGALAGAVAAYFVPREYGHPNETPGPSERRPPRSAFFVVECESCGARIQRPAPYRTLCVTCKAIRAKRWRARQNVLLMGCWRATGVGLFHAFSSITSGVLGAHGLSIIASGSLMAVLNGVSILALPVVAGCSALLGMRSMLSATSMMLVGSVLALLVAHVAEGPHSLWSAEGGATGDSPSPLMWLLPRLGLLGLYAGSVGGPVIPLVLIPASTKSLGPAYGMFDSMSHAGQALLTVLQALVLEHYSYTGAIVMLAVGLSCSLAIAWWLGQRLEVEERLKTEGPGDGPRGDAGARPEWPGEPEWRPRRDSDSEESIAMIGSVSFPLAEAT